VPEREWDSADNSVRLVVRTEGPAAAATSVVRRAAERVDPTVAISRVGTMQQLASASAAQRRLAMLLFGAFTGVALVLTIGGIYGLLAGNVTERRREIGVRTALGAAPGQILAMIVGEGLRLAAIGSAIGFLGAVWVTRFLRSLLFETQPTDPSILAGVGAILFAVTLIACAVPASRALRISPVSALRDG